MKFRRTVEFRRPTSLSAVARSLMVTSLPLGCLLVSLALWMRPPSPFGPSGAVQVRTLEVVDRAGIVRLRFSVATDGTPSVRLYDLAGTRRLELVVGVDGPAVMVFDGRGVERRMLEASPGLEPSSEDAAAGP